MNIRRQPNVHELVAERAAQRPDGIAVVSGAQQVTYAELAERVNRLANYLRHNGTGPESVVMVHLERSVDSIVALLGILAAGGTYLPVEPGVPDSRIRVFAEETGCTTVITQAKDAYRFEQNFTYELSKTEDAQEPRRAPLEKRTPGSRGGRWRRTISVRFRRRPTKAASVEASGVLW